MIEANTTPTGHDAQELPDSYMIDLDLMYVADYSNNTRAYVFSPGKDDTDMRNWINILGETHTTSTTNISKRNLMFPPLLRYADITVSFSNLPDWLEINVMSVNQNQYTLGDGVGGLRFSS
jgi:hypothetical protein